MRTTNCKRCGTKHLAREFNPDGTYRLVHYRNRRDHVCPDGVKPESTQFIVASSTPAFEAVADFEDVADPDGAKPESSQPLATIEYYASIAPDIPDFEDVAENEYLPETIDAPVVPDTMPVGDVYAEWLRKVQAIRKQAADTKKRVVVSPRATLNGALLLKAGFPESMVANMVIRKGMPTDDWKQITQGITFKTGKAPVVPNLPKGAHKQLSELVTVLKAGVHAILVGPAGSGKTFAARQAAEVICRGFTDRPMGPTVTEIDLLGFVTASGAFSEGFLMSPYGEGKVALLDEIDASHPAGLLAINQIASNGHCTFPNGETVQRHDDFVLVGSANTYGHGADRQYVGRAELDAATLDRFVVIDWDYDETQEGAWMQSALESR